MSMSSMRLTPVTARRSIGPFRSAMSMEYVCCWNAAPGSTRGSRTEHPCSSPRRSGKTSLNYTIALLRLLLSNGANVNAADAFGSTPLMNFSYGASHERLRTTIVSIVTVLLEAGANPNARGEDGNTALHAAASSNHCELVDLLLRHGADAHARSWSSIATKNARMTTGDCTKSSAVKQLLEAAIMRTEPAREPPHGTTLDALLPQLQPFLGKRCYLDAADDVVQLHLRSSQPRLTFFSYKQLSAAKRDELRRLCTSFTPTQIPFALVGERLHDRGPAVDDHAIGAAARNAVLGSRARPRRTMPLLVLDITSREHEWTPGSDPHEPFTPGTKDRGAARVAGPANP